MRTETVKEKVYWAGMIPEKDDFGGRISTMFIDGKTRRGPWAIMNRWSFNSFGLGLGVGLGQKYKKQADGRWLKTGG